MHSTININKHINKNINKHINKNKKNSNYSNFGMC
jgi:hypothetical protein